MNTIIPKHVQNAIVNAAKYHEKARKQQEIFESWIEEIYGEDVILDDCVRDTIIDLIEQSNNPHKAIKMITSAIEAYLEEK